MTHVDVRPGVSVCTCIYVHVYLYVYVRRCVRVCAQVCMCVGVVSDIFHGKCMPYN